MHIADILAHDKMTFSFEFFPPKSEAGATALFEHIRRLESLKPSFVSVTYGAGGSTRDRTHALVLRIKEETSLDPVPHLTCVRHTRSDITVILSRYAAAGVSNILALGGDVPQDSAGYDRAKDDFHHAADLVSFIKEFNDGGAHRDQRGFGIGVAGFPEGHPATLNRLREMDYLKAKVDAGADYMVTQLFFDNHDFFDFRERCEIAGIRIPILAGIMPIASLNSMQRIAETALGSHYPAKLMRSINRCNGDADAVRRVGVLWATEQCRGLLDHQVRGIHFYTLNNSEVTLEIYRNLGAHDSTNLRG
ncbi:MAG: methylenetetrahydrofolate reductase [NAD(P)H] [Phycisphaerae bacterium]